MKPFRAPTVVRQTTSNMQEPTEPPAKRRRVGREDGDDQAEITAATAKTLKKPMSVPKFHTPAARKPLSVVENQSSSQSGSQEKHAAEGYYTVLWRKFTMKKNKTWDGDGVLSLRGGYANLQDISGKELGRTACKGPLLIGSELKIGGKDIEIEAIISKEDFLAGRPFLGNMKQPAPSLKDVDETNRVGQKAQAKFKKLAETQKDKLTQSVSTSKASKGAFKAPLLDDTVQAPKKDKPVPVARHDPNARDALVMKRPRSVPKGKQVVDVVVDPLVTRNLRPHQREGVSFLYECVMGTRDYEGEGAILADEMGLGKTLQTIALLWTLLKQNPVYEEPPVVKKALIVCPVTLISNWRREIRKWLGNERIGVFEANNKKMRLTDFTHGKCYSVMIIGYEKLRMVQADLQKCADIDIVIADEGHRLKTAQNKSALAIKSLTTDRRIILSGTPIQNDLAEFHTMVDFVNPNLLSKYSVFKKEFETPILKSQQPGATEKDTEKGEARSEELANITGNFILRRTADILAKYLPPKTEYVVFCKPTEAQKSVYRSIIGSSTFNAALGSSAVSLELINVLKKVCNSPNLLLKKSDKGEGKAQTELLQILSTSLLKSPGASGKLQVLDSLLYKIDTLTDDKVVLISNYTSTVDVLAQLLSALSYKYERLDGQTPQNKRQEIVERFNRAPRKKAFVFLLSAKAGGVGLNLIGASRLILFDLDWNPSTDLQAMARIHRDGQKKPCFIYRMVTQGALDEKIFQRQVSKTGLADSIVDGKSGVSGFTREELRDLFSLDESDDCQTHKLTGCSCGGKGTPVAPPEDEHDDEGSSRNDLASLSSSSEPVVCDDDGTEVLNLEDDETPSYAAGKWKKAKDYDPQAEEEALQKERECKDSSGKAKMLSLMQYSHFDTSLVKDMPVVAGDDGGNDGEGDGGMDPLEGVIEDVALRGVLREDGKRIGFVMSKLGS